MTVVKDRLLRVAFGGHSATKLLFPTLTGIYLDAAKLSSKTGSVHFDSLMEAEVLVARWRRRYNAARPHSALGYRPPVPEAIQPWSQVWLGYDRQIIAPQLVMVGGITHGGRPRIARK